MRNLLSGLAYRGILWLLRSSEVARHDGMVLADLRSPDRQTPHFRETMLAALKLIQRVDARRSARVKKHLAWIVNAAVANGGAEYRRDCRACFIEFIEPSAVYDLDYLRGYSACILIHEATHGVLRSRGLPYTPELRERIERLCVREEERFVRRLATFEPDLAARLPTDFDARRWHWSWNASRWEKLASTLARGFKR